MDRVRDLPTWPLNEASRFVRAARHDWHVQELGAGPDLLLLHGAGGSSHSWRDIAPALSANWRIIALDLPGQGFTRAGGLSRCSLEGMSTDIAALCQHQGWHPRSIIGHSAGAAIALKLSTLLPEQPKIVGLNAALSKFDGIAGWLFPLAAKVLALSPFTAQLFTMGRGHQNRARRLIEGTGSHLDETGLALYARLIADPDHVNATLRMMAQWDLDPLLKEMPQLTAQTLFLTGAQDSAVPPSVSSAAAKHMVNAQHVSLLGLGHLCHEEDPKRTLSEIEAFL